MTNEEIKKTILDISLDDFKYWKDVLQYLYLLSLSILSHKAEL